MHRLLIVGIVLFLPLVAVAQSQGYSVTSITPIMVLKAVPGIASLQWLRIWNVSAAGGSVLWCSRTTITPTVNTAGSFPIQPGQFEEFRAPQLVPGAAVWCIADTGTAAVTVDAR